MAVYNAGVASGFRFNRYIVECKVTYKIKVNTIKFWFNRYIVECKGGRRVHFRAAGVRFNRYIVECKMAYGRKSETLIDQEVNKTQPGSVIIREFEEVGDLTVTS